MPYDPEHHARRSIRLRGYDYAQCGTYFITMCIQHRECLLGAVVDGVMEPNEAGKTVQSVWEALPKRFPSILLDAFVVMPNHVHGIFVIVPPNQKSQSKKGAASDKGAARSEEGAASGAPTVGKILRAFKSISAIHVNSLLLRSCRPLWQRNYYEHIIRDEAVLTRAREYIVMNPRRWHLDLDNPNGGAQQAAPLPMNRSDPP
jgi:REP element-mobilizing transposase RayT